MEDFIEIMFECFSLDQREFLIGFALTSTGSVEEKLKYVFRTYDQDKDGFISKKEIDRMVKVCSLIISYTMLEIVLLFDVDYHETSCQR